MGQDQAWDGSNLAHTAVGAGEREPAAAADRVGSEAGHAHPGFEGTGNDGS